GGRRRGRSVVGGDGGGESRGPGGLSARPAPRRSPRTQRGRGRRREPADGAGDWYARDPGRPAPPAVRPSCAGPGGGGDPSAGGRPELPRRAERAGRVRGSAGAAGERVRGRGRGRGGGGGR